MGTIRHRERHSFRGPVTLAGQQTWRSSSANTQFAGRTTVGCGSVTFTVSTTVVKSNAMIFFDVNDRGQGALAASTSLGFMTVKTISEANFFTAGWSTGNNAIPNNQIDVSWFIVNQG